MVREEPTMNKHSHSRHRHRH